MKRSDALKQSMFPFQAQEGLGAVQRGATLLDFYAIQAPRTPLWFKHVEPPDKPIHPGQFRYLFGSDSSYKHKAIVLRHHTDDDWHEDYYKEVPEETRTEIEADIAAWEEKYEAWRVAEPIWKHKNDFERLSQWQFSYATHMIEAREEWFDHYDYSESPEDADKKVQMTTGYISADAPAPQNELETDTTQKNEPKG
jgi:hypothetical protein